MPLLPSTYLLPSGFVHAMLFFGPAIFAPGAKIVVRRILAIGAFVIGPLFSMAFSATNNAAKEGSSGGSNGSDAAAAKTTTVGLFPPALGFPAGNGYANTWPAWWCFMSAAQALLILVGDFLARDNQGMTEREWMARSVERRRQAAAAAAAAAGEVGGKAAPASSRAAKKQPMHLTASASVQHEYEVAVPAPAATARSGGSTRRRAGAK